MPFMQFTSESLCFGLTGLISWVLSWKDASDGTTWIKPTLVRTNYGRWSEKLNRKRFN